LTCFALLCLLCSAAARAEDGSAAWLRYAPVSHPEAYKNLPSEIVVRTHSPSDQVAAEELRKGLSSMLGRNFTVVTTMKRGQFMVESVLSMPPAALPPPLQGVPRLTLKPEEFLLREDKQAGPSNVLIAGGPQGGTLYGVFRLLEYIAAGKPLPAADRESPAVPIRWTDEWDNLNGSIERGYAGRSIFFDGGHVRQDLTRAGEYARLLASVGINGCNVNNVNADLDLLTTEHLHEFARIADAFRPWGVKLALSIDLTSPQTVGGLNTFDPLDPTVVAWWQTKVDEIYKLIPDFGGFTVKADSEGRKGPSQYGRSPADAANVLARALKPHGGVVLYRGFVYNNHLDWNDLKADRARAGVDNFVRYDGKFEPNVIIQIKEGPIDFQAREPVSPLISALRHTNEAIEMQTTQEYTGQQRHMVWLPSMWKWVLDTDMRAPDAKGNPRSTPVKEILEGKSFGQPMGGFISVTNIGLDANWLHHPMAMANLYGFGKLAWNPDEKLDDILDTWTRLTWGNDPDVVRTITAMQRGSWHVYESYTGPNGTGTLTNILGYHFGPGIESAERNGWGQWFRGDKDAIGMDRTVSTGTGFAGQYPSELAAKYESLAETPDDLLLFFHHVPYNYKLHSGKTLIQSIYDTHYEGARAAGDYVGQWQSLKGKIDGERYRQTLRLFEFQAGHAIEWRDAVNAWFQHTSGIPDTYGRVGHAPGRIEAESMTADGYTPVDVTPWETASGGKAMECRIAAGCTLTTTLTQRAGTYDIAVQYFDLHPGLAVYTLSLNGRQLANWAADDTLPPAQPDPHPDGQDATRLTVYNVALKPGDTLQLRGIPDLKPALTGLAPPDRADAGLHQPPTELAPVDYIQIGPGGRLTPQ
jgi:alpha-glucuronidase